MGKKEKIITGVVVGLLILAVLVGLALLNPGLLGLGQEEEAAQQVTITVTVVHSDETEKTFTYTTQERYVGAALQKEGLIDGPMEEYGMYIQEVDGERAVYEESGAYWAFYIDDQYAFAGIDQTPVDGAVEYRLVYTAE